MVKKQHRSKMWLVWVTIIIIILIFGGCYLYKYKPFGNGNGGQSTDNNSGGNGAEDQDNQGQGGGELSGDEQEPPITCYDTELPPYGDLGPLCAVETCEEGYNCAHYWDYTEQEHKCGCTETFYCGQYCFSYHFTSGCECPPNSYMEIPDRSHHMCVPNGYHCENGTIVE